MSFPAFFDAAPVVRTRDPLATLLGATEDGVIDYRYADAVRLAGHSCPTVAGAFLTGRAALAALYPGTVPERGGVEVTLPDAENAGVTGVIAQVLTLLTGAAADNGFKGLGGRYARNHLLHFDSVSATDAIDFRRRDNGAQVAVSLDLSRVPVDPAMSPLLGAILHGQATPADEAQFGRLWQERVQRLLLQHADDPEVVRVTAA